MGWAWISRCSPGVLQDIINAHQGTLQYIELPMIITAGGEIGYVPDVSRCTQLKKLHVYASNCFNEDAKWVAPKLSNPSLQHIVFDLTKFYDYVAFFHDLREREVQWMEHFAKRVKAGHSSSAGLQTLSMVYHSRIEDYSTMSTETVIWPWEYFEEAARIFNLYGIKMLYDAPSFTRAELEERLAVVRAYAARCELEGEEGEGEEEDEKTGEGEGEDEEEEEDEEDEEGEEGVNEKFNIPIPRQLEVGQHQLSKYWPVQPRQDPDA
ncbi:MAG: hypothetical protein M1820_009453 [Bogoriella megaspora]|nr:MAG: hypothetical protein M1820_009453 [Bogoriella megaspora]